MPGDATSRLESHSVKQAVPATSAFCLAFNQLSRPIVSTDRAKALR